MSGSDKSIDDIDTLNAQGVGTKGDGIIILAPRQQMTKREALAHAAWLVALADDNDDFQLILNAVWGVFPSSSKIDMVCDCGAIATCFGSYEGAAEDSPACDDCCGHGNEDGRCTPVRANHSGGG